MRAVSSTSRLTDLDGGALRNYADALPEPHRSVFIEDLRRYVYGRVLQTEAARSPRRRVRVQVAAR